MADSGRRRKEAKRADLAGRQANLLTFQILAVAALLCAALLAKSFHPRAFEQVRGFYALLESDGRTARAAIGWDEAADRLGALLAPLFDGLRERLPPLPGPFGSSDGSDSSGSSGASGPSDDFGSSGGSDDSGGFGSSGGTAEEAAGVLLPVFGELQRPRNVTFSPVLLTAQPRPPASGRVSSGFGWRENPLRAGSQDFHTGLDIAAPEGTPVYAALPGVVADAGNSESYGNYILLAHAGGLETRYAHCSALVARTGEVIRQGERIALVGSTGRATGPHLHFEIRQDGVCCDPLIQLLPEG